MLFDTQTTCPLSETFVSGAAHCLNSLPTLSIKAAVCRQQLHGPSITVWPASVAGRVKFKASKQVCVAFWQWQVNLPESPVCATVAGTSSWWCRWNCTYRQLSLPLSASVVSSVLAKIADWAIMYGHSDNGRLCSWPINGQHWSCIGWSKDVAERNMFGRFTA